MLSGIGLLGFIAARRTKKHNFAVSRATELVNCFVVFCFLAPKYSVPIQRQDLAVICPSDILRVNARFTAKTSHST